MNSDLEPKFVRYTVPDGGLPLPQTIEVIANESAVDMQEEAEARVARARKRTVKDPSRDGSEDYDNSPQQIGPIPPRGTPNLDPDGDDGRQLVGEGEDDDEYSISRENARRLTEGTIYGRGSVAFNAFSGARL
jgi:hypothetical protein